MITRVPSVDWARWREECKRSNEGVELKVGLRVTDPYGAKGVITELHYWDGPLTAENHGGITVMLDTGDEEHYVIYRWDDFLRAEKDAQ